MDDLTNIITEDKKNLADLELKYSALKDKYDNHKYDNRITKMEK